MKVLDDDGNECPPGVVGEIYMRPRPGGTHLSLCRQYRQNPRQLGFTGRSGLVRRGRATCILADRRWTCSPSAGRNVYPAEIENALAEHPAVLSCSVVGVPHGTSARCRTR